jgi:hypothetical protein
VNEELLAASDALLVSNNGFINFLQLSNVKPIQICSATATHQVISTTWRHLKERIMTSIMPLKMPTDYRENDGPAHVNDAHLLLPG